MKIAITGGTGFVGAHLAAQHRSVSSTQIHDEQIRKGLPQTGPFTLRDLRCCHA
jgi:dTDP-4-dehydrorhamnose reductase